MFKIIAFFFFYIEVHVSSQESELSCTFCICFLEVSIFPLSTILVFDLGIVPKVRYFVLLVFMLLVIC